jgi:ABC-type uncharacterized transport system ATPase subunit
MGPNGASKSTTIKIMTNLIRSTCGRASLFGMDVQREPTRALVRVGAVIETPEFYGYLSPLGTLAYAGRLRGMSKHEIEKRSDEVLKAVLPVAKVDPWLIPTAAAGIIFNVLSPTTVIRPPNGGGKLSLSTCPTWSHL